ncbi:MAG: ABC transporter permease [Spirochaetales bacterium]|nr:ABC transporter permease [Spirochaetales bacterium]
MKLTPLTERRINNFRANRRAVWSFRILLVIFAVSLFSEFVANDRPIMVYFKGGLYFPVFISYPETEFGGTFQSAANYRDPYVQKLINNGGWALWPLIHFRFDTINLNLPQPAPSPPSLENPLGTDDQGRDLLAQIIYGLRVSLLFGFILTLISPVIGIAVGAAQGYFGGKVDLFFQRILEIYSSIPTLYVIIIIASIIPPQFWLLLFIFLLFEWVSFVGIVRAEFLRARNFDYVRAARALGVGHSTIMFRHILPNALASTLTYAPFILNGSIAGLASLDFLGFGLPTSEPSLGRLISQARGNLASPWIGLTTFFVLAILFSLLIFIGEGVRDAFDTRKML